MKNKSTDSVFWLFCVVLLILAGCESPEDKLGRLREELSASESKEERLQLIEEVTSIELSGVSPILLQKLSDINFRDIHPEIVVKLGQIRPVHTQTVRGLVEKLSQAELRNQVAEALKSIGPKAHRFLIPRLKDANQRDDAYYALSQMVVDAKPELVKLLKDENQDLRKDTLTLLLGVGNKLSLSESEVKSIIDVFNFPPLDPIQLAEEFTRARNLLVASPESSVPILKETISSSDNSEKLPVRVGSALALFQIDKSQQELVLPILGEGLKDPFLANIVTPGLVGIGKPALPLLEKALSDETTSYLAADILGQLGADSLPILLANLKGSDDYQKQVVLEAIKKLGPAAEPALNDLIPLIGNPDLGGTAAEAMGLIGSKSVPYLVKSLNSRNRDEQSNAIKGLSVVTPLPKSAIGALTGKISNSNLGVEVVIALTKETKWKLDKSKLVGTKVSGGEFSLKADSVFRLLRRAIQDRSPAAREQSKQAFQQLGPVGVPVLLNLVKSVKNTELRAEIVELLGNMSSTLQGHVVGNAFIHLNTLTEVTPLAIPTLLRLVKDDNQPWLIRQVAQGGLVGPSRANHAEALKAVEQFEKVMRAHDLVLSFRQQMNQIKVNKISDEILQAGEAAVPFLIEGFTSEVSIMRGRCASVLAQMGKSVIPVLKAAKKNGDKQTVYWVDYTLGKMK